MQLKEKNWNQIIFYKMQV